MKKLIMLITLSLLILAGCGQSEDNNAENNQNNTNTQEEVTLKVASLIPPMTEVLEVAEPLLAEQGIKLEIVVLGDNIQPNTALQAKEVDANFFGHGLWMQTFNENNDANLVVVEPIYHAALGLYSKEYNSMEELPEGATIALPNDPTNQGRALAFLDDKGIITLDEEAGIYGSLKDIVENPNNYDFQEVDLLLLASMYDDVDASIMYPSYAVP